MHTQLMPVKWLIVGSGPSGVAVANYLIANGIRPMIIDGGVEVSTKDSTTQQHSGMNKTWFGSEMSYFQPSSSILKYGPYVDARASFARGGFSRVWGATFDFTHDFADWPSDMIPTREDIESVKALVPHSVTTWGTSLNSVGLSGSERSYSFYSQVSKRLSGSDLIVKPSVIAIDTNQNSVNYCVACERCLVGCPRNSIWFAGDILERWDTLGLIDYRPGFVVQHIEEDEQVSVHMTHNGNTMQTITADKVFLAAGAISTAAIVVRSGLQEEVIIRDSSTAIGAAFQLRSSKGQSNGSHHSLSQWWIGSKNFIAQVYPPTIDLIEIAVKRFRLPNFFTGIIGLVVMRIHPVIAYLPLEESGCITVRSIDGIAIANGHKGEKSPRVSFKKKLSQLAKIFFRSGYLMHHSMFQFKAPGGGYHHGSSFPQGSLSDYVGRPKFFRNVHIVDSSVLPSLPLGSITPTVMANAVRIVRTVMSEGIS